jgi:hypothetical protein
MDRTDRNEKDDTQKTKLIFLSLAVLVAVLLIWSFVAANKARSERNMANRNSKWSGRTMPSSSKWSRT